MPNPRPQKIADRIQTELAEVIQRRLQERIGFVTVTSVEVTRDLQSAKVYVSSLSEGGPEGAVKELDRAKGFLRTELARRIRLRRVPELTFVPDHSAEHGLRVAEILEGLRQKGEFDDTPSSESSSESSESSEP